MSDVSKLVPGFDFLQGLVKDPKVKLEKCLFLSIAAGITLKQLESWLGGEARVIRSMPNTPALVLAGAAAFARGQHATDEDAALAAKHADVARRSLTDEPLVKLLEAQSAQLRGDRAAVKSAFEAMLASPDTAALGLRGQPLLTDRFHVTLHHLGDYVGLPNDIVAKGEAAGGALAHAPFEVAFDRAASFANRPGNNPFTLQGGEGVAALVAFQGALGLKMAGAALRPDKQFAPHITLLYDGQVVPAQAITPIRWTVDRFVLVQSKLGQTQHIVLRSWDLTG